MKRLTRLLFFLIITLTTKAFSQDWKTTLKERLPEYGHRNWIIIADAAYPKQSSPGIETICTEDNQLEVLKQVLKEIKTFNHIQPIIMLDSELEYVPEKNAAGVEEYRKKLKQILEKMDTKSLPHVEIIEKLDKSSKLFNVLLLKTNLAIPYTSVFIELDCGYWNTDKEKELRDLINQK